MTSKENRPGMAEAESRCERETDSTRYCRQLRVRRTASYRLPVRESGRADPWWYEPRAAGYEAAAAHLLGLGLTPAPNREALQAMRSRGGAHYRAANLIAERWESAA